MMLKEALKQFWGDRRAVVVLILGTMAWSATMVKSGIEYGFGLGFWGANGHDGVWHLAIINSLARGSIEMPVFAGEALQNYHIGFDLAAALINRISGISTLTLYFQIIPVVLASFTGLATYTFVYLWKKSRSAAVWSMFFVYFGGGFGWRESMYWSQQSISSLINPPFAMSLLVLLLGLILILRIKQKSNWILIAAAIVLFGSIVQIKAYAGILAIVGLGFAGLYEYLNRKKKDVLIVCGGAFVVALVLLVPALKESGSFFEFKPFWFLETMMQFSDRLNFPRFAEAMVNYKTGGIYYKAIPAYILTFLIFWYGNMGTRFLAELQAARILIRRKLMDAIYIFMILTILAGVIVPLLFVQKGTAWNTIQFFYYSLFFAGIMAGIFVGEHVKKGLWKLVIIILTVPTAVATLFNHYLPGRPPAMLPKGEMVALRALEKEPNGVVLTYPYDGTDKGEPPVPLYLYESTAYVSAFSSKPVFLEDQVNLDITGYDWRGRREEVMQYFANPSEEFLKNNNISYVYLTGRNRHAKVAGVEALYVSEDTVVYRVK